MVKTHHRWDALVAAPLAQDAKHWQRKGFASGKRGVALFVTLARYGGFRATVLHRVAFWAQANGIVGLPTILHELNQALHGLEITPSIPTGAGLYMPHTVGSVITARRIGTDVELQGGITLGQRTDDGFPVLEDQVVVACGARVLGRIVVGRGATVGANAVVIRDVPDGALAVGVPARIICGSGPYGDSATASQSALDGAIVESTQRSR